MSFPDRVNGKQPFDRRERPVSNKLVSVYYFSVDLVSISVQLQLEQTSACAGFIFHKCSMGCYMQM